MAKDADILVGLYLGTSKISVVVSEWDPTASDEAQIIGIGQAPSRGVRKGLIVNLDQAANAVSSALTDAEAMAGYDIREVTVAFSGADAQTKSVWGMISLSRTPRQVTDEDVLRVIESALSGLDVSANQSVLHLLPIKYSIDGNSGIDDPLGMTGVRLEVELQAVTVPTALVQNVLNCVHRAGVEVRGLVFKPLAAALGSLSREEREAGAVSLSIGGGTTAIAMFNEGRPLAFRVLTIGGDHVTNDLSCVMKIPVSVAEELKKTVSLDPDEPSPGELQVDNRGRRQTLDGAQVRQVVACRLEELLEDYVAPFVAEHSRYQFPSGVVLTGGVSQTPGIEAFASSLLAMPVRCASATPIQKLRPDCDTSQYALLMGIMLYLLEKRRNRYRYLDTTVESLMRGSFSVDVEHEVIRPRKKAAGFVSKVVKSLKDLF